MSLIENAHRSVQTSHQHGDRQCSCLETKRIMTMTTEKKVEKKKTKKR